MSNGLRIEIFTGHMEASGSKRIYSIWMDYLPQVLALLVTITSINSYAGTYRLGGSCMSQGSWTRSAEDFGDSIQKSLQEMQADPNCKGLADVFAAPQAPPKKASGGTKDAEGNPEDAEVQKGNLSAVDGAIRSSGGNASPVMFSSLLGTLLEGSSWDMLYGGADVDQARQRMIATGLANLNGLFGALPKYTQCLKSRPAVSTTMLGGAIKMLAAYASSGETNLSGLGETIRGLTNYMRDSSFTDAFVKVDQAELALSISCLAEAASENYCKAKDAYELLKVADSLKKNSGAQISENKDEIYNPTEGYFVLTRETPIITSWLQKVMFGVQPRTLSDSGFKNKVLDNINDFIQAQNLVYGSFGQAQLRIQPLTDQDARKNLVFAELKELFEMMAGVKYHEGGVRGDVNFYVQAMPTIQIPFFLIDSPVPPAVLPNNEGKMVMDVWDYMQNGGKYMPQFNEPDKLLKTIGLQLDKLIKLANANASAYFQQQLIVDRNNLVDQSLASSTISVYEAFTHIDAYLTKLIDRAERGEAAPEMGLLPNLNRTRDNVRTVLKTYQDLFAASRVQIDKLHGASAADHDAVKAEVEKEFLSDKFQEDLTNIVSTVYTSFNVMLQRDTFLLNRMIAFVNYDYSYYVRHPEQISKYQHDLLAISASALMATLSSAYNSNPSEVALDLQGAQTMNLTNIKTIELFFRDKMMADIARFRLISEGKGDSWWTQKKDSYKRWWVDSQKDSTILKESIHPEYLSTRIYSWFALFSQTGLRLAYRNWANRERYQITSTVFEQAPIEQDDVYGSIDQMKSRLCLQSLQFTNYFEFHNLCSGSVLKSWILDDQDAPNLSQDYEKLYQDYVAVAVKAKASKSAEDSQKQKSAYDDNICVLRDYRRRNYVEWLTKQIAGPVTPPVGSSN